MRHTFLQEYLRRCLCRPFQAELAAVRQKPQGRLLASSTDTDRPSPSAGSSLKGVTFDRDRTELAKELRGAKAWYPVDDEELEGLTEEELAEMTKEPEPYAGQAELDPDNTAYAPVYGGRTGGYTPFEYLSFSDNEITHDVVVEVNAPVSKVYQIWLDRINYHQWFDLIGQMIVHKEDPTCTSYFFFYRWGQLPTLELYTTLDRKEEIENECILERSIDGMDMVVGAFFKELAPERTEVRLRLGYLLPENLNTHVGPVGVWGDINDILKENMQRMKEWVEWVDLDELKTARAEDETMMWEHVEKTSDMRADAYARYAQKLEAQAAELEAKAAAEKEAAAAAGGKRGTEEEEGGGAAASTPPEEGVQEPEASAQPASPVEASSQAAPGEVREEAAPARVSGGGDVKSRKPAPSAKRSSAGKGTKKQTKSRSGGTG